MSAFGSGFFGTIGVGCAVLVVTIFTLLIIIIVGGVLVESLQQLPCELFNLFCPPVVETIVPTPTLGQ